MYRRLVDQRLESEEHVDAAAHEPDVQTPGKRSAGRTTPSRVNASQRGNHALPLLAW
jgi:hypothetical protein